MVSTNLETWQEVKDHLTLLKEQFEQEKKQYGIFHTSYDAITTRLSLVNDLLTMMRRERK
jgi:hypothetical protein